MCMLDYFFTCFQLLINSRNKKYEMCKYEEMIKHQCLVLRFVYFCCIKTNCNFHIGLPYLPVRKVYLNISKVLANQRRI